MCAPEVQAVSFSDEHFSVDCTLAAGLCIPCLAGSGRRQETHRHASGSGEGFGTPKRQGIGPRGFRSLEAAAYRPIAPGVDPDAFAARKSNASPAQRAKGHVLWTTAMPSDRGLSRHPSHAALEKRSAGDGGLTSPCHQENLVPTRTTTKGVRREMRRIAVTPHVARNTKRPCGSAIDGRTDAIEATPKSIMPAAASRSIWADQNSGGLRS